MHHMNTPHTPKIRVTVPISPEVLALFQRLSVTSGQSVGRAMGEWLEETKEGLEPMIAILEQHKKSPKKAIQSLQLYAGTLSDLTGDLFDRVQNLDGNAERVAALAADAPRFREGLKTVLTPPSSNTGGKGRKTTNKSMGVKK
jgi:hypothetical protein